MIELEVFMDIHSLHREGLSQRAIARKLGIHRHTVKKHLEARDVPKYVKDKRRASVLDPFRQIIEDFVAEDNYQVTWIFDRLKRMGYTGSYATLRD